jgi:hypothetical protein
LPICTPAIAGLCRAQVAAARTLRDASLDTVPPAARSADESCGEYGVVVGVGKSTAAATRATALSRDEIGTTYFKRRTTASAPYQWYGKSRLWGLRSLLGLDDDHGNSSRTG